MDLIIDRETISLWPGEAPYSAESPDQRQPSLMPYPIEGARGAVVVVPGGGYCMKADHEGRAIAEMINEAGVAAYVLDYRVKPCHYLAPLSDAKRAIRLVRSMGYEKVAILGFSAGGHLCCAAATLYDAGDPDADDPVERLSSRPDGFIPCYAVVSFTAFRHQGSVDALLGEKKTDYALLRHFSAELNVTPDTPPAFIWHTSPDPGVPVENSLNLASALSHAGVPFELHVFPVGGHGLGLAPNEPRVAQWAGQCQKWLVKEGYGRR
ncbi:MAG: alpha/beta hydrolase [Clostridia bacterium]|nr:alpha/beta hydrolase [Clostridia bacterium]